MEERHDGNIIQKDIEEEMRTSYIDYAMSVIVSRALPDVRDGLKPVHRRILYAMHEDGITSDKPYRKSANTVGSVLGRYHPHGDSSVYDAMVRMAQDFSMRYMLIDGHGNFGSVDGDGAAAMRYTESRMSKISEQMLRDIEKNTVDFMPNYDDRLQEPTVLPTRIPTLLINGSSGIAVGMATNIPPHNLTEVINGIIKIIDEDEVTDEDLMSVIKGPDFPTEGIILGREGIKKAYTTGKGKITLRAETDIEEMSGNRQRIIVSSLPYQVNKAKLIKNISDLSKEKKIEGISEVRDESDRKEKVRVVIELKRDANAQVVLNQLFKGIPVSYSIQERQIILKREEGQATPKVRSVNVTGLVTDGDGNPVIGATVRVKDTDSGVITDIDGKYTVKAHIGQSLVFSYIGYVTEEREIKDGSSINIRMMEASTNLDDVVIIGYGQQKKESVVSSINSVKPAEISIPTANLSNMIAGQVAGVIAIQRSGEPGNDAASFWIRGQSSWMGGTDPLVLVDGVPRDMNDIDVDEIETFTVLKDAAATAVYGAEGANGVVLITSKRGLAQKTRVDVNAQFSIVTPTRLPELMDAYNYLNMYTEAEWNEYVHRSRVERSRESGEFPRL